MKVRFLVIVLIGIMLGASNSKPLPIMWHLDCPVVAYWCAPRWSEGCREIRPSDDYDFVVTGIMKSNPAKATIEMEARIPDSFVIPATNSPTPSLSPGLTPPSPIAVSTGASYGDTAVTWVLDLDRVNARFVLLRASQHLTVTTVTKSQPNAEIPDTEIDWEGTCTRVNDKLLTVSPPPKPAPGAQAKSGGKPPS